MTKREKKILKTIIHIVKELCIHDSGGHDWSHISRVHALAMRINKTEYNGNNQFIVEIAAYLHDYVDWKSYDGSDTEAAGRLQKLLHDIELPTKQIRQITFIINQVSFKGAYTKTATHLSEECSVVQDADRLDALGAIGIARTFAYGGKTGRTMYDPKIKPVLHKTFASYKSKKSTSINHFYEKLFLLNNRLNTKAAKKIAGQRDIYMKRFVDHFIREWNGEE
jgi:uncharacterized protein